ncbi:hypothetical protein YC2023_097091 [Brassica napus]
MSSLSSQQIPFIQTILIKMIENISEEKSIVPTKKHDDTSSNDVKLSSLFFKNSSKSPTRHPSL